MSGGYYDRDGNPIGNAEWSELFYTDRRVALTAIDDQVEVSTVFIGLELGPFGADVPLIYETMICGGAHNERKWHTPNCDAALAAHDQAVALARETARVQ